MRAASLDISVFDRMVKFSVNNKCKLKGVIDFEIAKRKGEKVFYVPVFYAKARFFADMDAVFITNYLDEAKKAKEFTLKYMKELGITNVQVKEITGPWKFNNNEVFDLLAYEIKF